jgi:3-methylfumaryl-CoA hydratase
VAFCTATSFLHSSGIQWYSVNPLKTLDFFGSDAILYGDRRRRTHIMDQINLGAWIDRGQQTIGGVSAQTSAMIHAVLGQPGTTAPRHADQMPPLWHWYAFPPTASMDELGVDGHPRVSDFMPPVRLNRRMWAGGNLEFFKPIHIGDTLTRTSRVAKITEKDGATGPMVFVKLEHDIMGRDGLAIREQQDIVYLEIPDSFRAPKPVPAPKAPDVAEVKAMTAPMLFRYSAITFNAHRIHYDLPYTRDVEHYPDLVVHGPMQANLLMDMAVRHKGAVPRLFSFRGVHPVFCPSEVGMSAVKSSDAEWNLCTTTDAGHQGMQATAIWEI